MRFFTLSHRFRRQVLSRVQLVRIVLAILLLGSVMSAWYFFFRPITRIQLPDHAGRTNFLILGIGGGGHDGPDLTDTIIFVSIKTSTGDVTLISLPRDLWVPSLQSKLNAAYSVGVAKKGPSAGFVLSKSSVSEIIRQPVDFAVLADFSTFVTAIDMVGGIDVRVDRTFDDYLYPVAGKENDACGLSPASAAAAAALITDDAGAAAAFPCRFEHLHFSQGPLHLNGALALKYTRSRHSPDLSEGTDFARSARQAKVIAAFKKKLFSNEIITHPRIYEQLYKLAVSSVVSDLPPRYYPSLAKLILKAKNSQIHSYSVVMPDQLYSPPVSEKYGNQWVLLPNNNDPTVIYSFVASKLP